jgi:hypothetical protein
LQNAVILRHACRWSRETRSTAAGQFSQTFSGKVPFYG